MRKILLSTIFILFATGLGYGQAVSVTKLGNTQEVNIVFDHEHALNKLIERYRIEKALLPGISIAIMQNGEVVYSDGFGLADIDNNIPATSETVYGWASISKTIAGVLSVQYSSRLDSGGEPAIDLNQPTFYYLRYLPRHHKHSVKNLLQHTACVAHYSNTTPPMPVMPLKSYSNQFEASEDLWDIPLIENCEIGKDYNYSTHAFTLVGAVLEEVSGKSLVEQIDYEIAKPLGLFSFRVQFEENTLQDDPNRSVAYDWRNAVEYENSFWKIFGGGIESNVIDLVKYGDAIRSGKLVEETLRDSLLWKDGGHNYGLGWMVSETEIGGKHYRIAEHGGSQLGARSHLQIYRDAGLSIAILTNDRWWKKNGETELRHNPKELADDIAKVILQP